MAIEKIFTRTSSKFSERISQWCESKNLEVISIEKDDKMGEDIDSLVIFHEDHNLDSASVELRDSFEKKLKPIHKIDVNGTKQVSVSHFGLWVERNNCKNILMVGTDTIFDSTNFELLLSKM
ncbi:MAG: hypothetical protein KJ941_12755 [Bacteroidetes bacterium]|nr:hypothetical protein [Bacteroidota bacterium]